MGRELVKCTRYWSSGEDLWSGQMRYSGVVRDGLFRGTMVHFASWLIGCGRGCCRCGRDTVAIDITVAEIYFSLE